MKAIRYIASLLLLAAALIAPQAQAQVLRDADYNAIGRINGNGNVRTNDYHSLGSFENDGRVLNAAGNEVARIKRMEIFAPDGALIGCIAEQDGTTYAQISALVGSWDDRSEKDAWRENLALASELGNRLNAACPNLFRSLTLENSPYNQSLTAHSLTLSVGAAGNSVKEAKASANLLAEVFAKYLWEN